MAQREREERGRPAAADAGAGRTDFQKHFREARNLDAAQFDAAFRHGFDARERFADRPFGEVERWLRESWDGIGSPAPWHDVRDIVRSGYERYKGAGLDQAADLAPEALDRLEQWTTGGSVMGGAVIGDRPQLGGATPTGELGVEPPSPREPERGVSGGA